MSDELRCRAAGVNRWEINVYTLIDVLMEWTVNMETDVGLLMRREDIWTRPMWIM